jgi:hypothetical protein
LQSNAETATLTFADVVAAKGVTRFQQAAIPDFLPSKRHGYRILQV